MHGMPYQLLRLIVTAVWVVLSVFLPVMIYHNFYASKVF